jgi:hypothetical protein
MNSLIAIIGLLMLAIVIGKHTRQIGLRQYVITAFIALTLVCIVLYEMFTIPHPTP